MNKSRPTGKYIALLIGITAVLIAACAPGTLPMIMTPTPDSTSATSATCQGIQLDAPCDPRPFFETYAQADQFEEFAWDLFLYMNWPAKAGVRGEPDTSKSLADRATSTWETWKDLREALPPAGTVPLAWDEPAPNSGFYPMDRIPQISGTSHWVMDTINSPPQTAWFGLRMNRDAYEYIIDRGLYNVEGQLAFVNDQTAPVIDFPQDSIEIKSTWLVMTPTVCSETACPYHVANPPAGLMGLTGLHIMSKIQENWFWATFEHVDNGTNTNALQTLPPTERAQQVNETMHQQLAGTVWENYILRGAQWDFVDPAGNPTLVSNTQIETRFQPTSSCITCHALASRGDVGDGFISFFQIGPGGDLEGWVGEAPWQLYCEDGDSIVPSGGNEPRGELFCEKYNREFIYRSTDYAWILRLAFRVAQSGQ